MPFSEVETVRVGEELLLQVVAGNPSLHVSGDATKLRLLVHGVEVSIPATWLPHVHPAIDSKGEERVVMIASKVGSHWNLALSHEPSQMIPLRSFTSGTPLTVVAAPA